VLNAKLWGVFGWVMPDYRDGHVYFRWLDGSENGASLVFAWPTVDAYRLSVHVDNDLRCRCLRFVQHPIGGFVQHFLGEHLFVEFIGAVETTNI
jgi:hypothetical protein